jgi:hypothetical protein
MSKQGTKGQFKAHERAANQAKKAGKSDREATIYGLVGELEFLTGLKL